MSKTKVSYNQLEKFIRVAPAYANTKKGTLIAYAINRVLTQCQTIGKSIQDELTTIQITYALTDPPNDATGKLVMSPDGTRYEFSREGALLRDAAIKKLTEAENVEIKPFFITLVPQDLTEVLLEALSGLVIKRGQVDEILEKRWLELENDPEAGNENKPTSPTNGEIPINEVQSPIT